MASGLSDDDLLERSLTAEDDLTAFHRPWNPWSLVVCQFFVGPLAGGALAAWNFRRLGMPRWFAPTFAIYVVWFLVGALVMVEVNRPSAGTATRPESNLTAEIDDQPAATPSTSTPDESEERFRESRQSSRNRTVLRFANLVPAFVVAWLQRRRFRVFIGGDEQPASLWIPGVIALIVSLVVVPAVVMILAALRLV